MADVQVFEAKFSPFRIILLVGLCLAFCAMGLFLMGLIGDVFRDRVDIITQAMGGLAVIYFGILSLHYLRLLGKGQPALRIDASGLLDRHMSDQLINWEHISDLRIRKIRHCRLGITFWTQLFIDYRIDPEFRGQLTGFDAWIRRGLAFGNGGRTSLLHNSLACDFETLVGALHVIPPEHARLQEA